MIGLTMITKGDENPESLSRCFNSVAKWVDGIWIAITTEDKDRKIRDVCKRYGANYKYVPLKFHRKIGKKEVQWLKKYLGYKPKLKVGDRIFQFDKARNYSFKNVDKKMDWILWLDVDDVMRNAHNLKKVEQWADKLTPKPADALFFNYLYQVIPADKGEKCTVCKRPHNDLRIKHVLIEHLRERFVRNGNKYKWIAPIHETLIEQTQTTKIDVSEFKEIKDELPDVVHLTSQERMVKALKRNLKNLEMSIYDNKGKDPRPIYYLGKAYFDLKTSKYHDKAEALFEIYLKSSGWKEERSQCWEYMGEIYRGRKQHNNSIKCFHNALIEHEGFPSTYLNMSFSYLIKEEWDRALSWMVLSARVPAPKSTLVNNPRDLTAKMLEIGYLANLKLNKLDEAWASAVKLVEMFPEKEEMKNRYNFTTQLKQERELTQMFMRLAKFYESTGQTDKLPELVRSAPEQIKNNPFIVDLHKKVIPPRKWGEKEIAIYTGPGFTTWSPKQISNPGESFVGGSEEAVVYIAQELNKLGWKVTVFNDPGGDEGDHEGVKYLQHFKFNNKDEFNILIGWRNIKFFESDYTAKKKYVWCHDILNPIDHTPELLKKIDKLIVLSPWHRTNVPDVPDEKIMISSNGVSL